MKISFTVTIPKVLDFCSSEPPLLLEDVNLDDFLFPDLLSTDADIPHSFTMPPDLHYHTEDNVTEQLVRNVYLQPFLQQLNIHSINISKVENSLNTNNIFSISIKFSLIDQNTDTKILSSQLQQHLNQIVNLENISLDLKKDIQYQSTIKPLKNSSFLIYTQLAVDLSKDASLRKKILTNPVDDVTIKFQLQPSGKYARADNLYYLMYRKNQFPVLSFESPIQFLTHAIDQQAHLRFDILNPMTAKILMHTCEDGGLKINVMKSSMFYHHPSPVTKRAREKGKTDEPAAKKQKPNPTIWMNDQSHSQPPTQNKTANSTNLFPPPPDAIKKHLNKPLEYILPPKKQ